MLPTAGVVTVFVPTVNATVLAPAGTLTVAGTIAMELGLESATLAPPSGAEPLRTIFPADGPQPPITVVGVSVSVESATAQFVSDTLLLLFGSELSPEITAVWERWPGPVVRAFTTISLPRPIVSNGARSHVTTVGVTAQVSPVWLVAETYS